MILLRFAAAVLAVALPPSIASAQDRNDPLDQRLTACLAAPAAETTAGQQDCLTRAYDAWDRELNKAYGELMRRAGREEAGRLREAQRRWIAYRDGERAYLDLRYSREATGTQGGVDAGLAMVQVVRDRVLTLRSHATGPCGAQDC